MPTYAVYRLFIGVINHLWLDSERRNHLKAHQQNIGGLGHAIFAVGTGHAG